MAVGETALKVERIFFESSLLRYIERSYCALVVMNGAQYYHVFSVVSRHLGELYNVVILDKRMAADTAAETSLLAKLAFYARRYVS